MSTTLETMPGAIEMNARNGSEYDEILTPDALRFIVLLHDKFEDRRRALMKARTKQQKELDRGVFPDFNPESEYIRTSRWQVAPVKPELEDRRIEITGSVDRKSIINAMNSGANVFMADFEDSTSPTWDNLMQGQINLREAVRGTLEYETPEKSYRLNGATAVLFVRPRGLHMEELNIKINGRPMSASLVDFGLYFFHNAHRLIDKGSAPYFYLPKIESHCEARWWNQVFMFSQYQMGIPQGTVKATILVENILAAFQVHEILYEIRDHSAGMNCGRWDYIFSFIRKFHKYSSLVLPNREQVTMKAPFMQSFRRLVIDTCHKRNTYAIGGMSAFMPVKGQTRINNDAIQQVQKDKIAEIRAGHDGTWVAHPELIAPVREVFEEHMEGLNQIQVQFEEFDISPDDLMSLPLGNITEDGIRKNVAVGILYLASWYAGRGSVSLFHLIEDTATAEISRAQLWQWIHNTAKMNDGRVVTRELYEQLKAEEIDKIKNVAGEGFINTPAFHKAIALFDKLVLSREFIDFLTDPGIQDLEKAR